MADSNEARERLYKAHARIICEATEAVEKAKAEVAAATNAYKMACDALADAKIRYSPRRS